MTRDMRARLALDQAAKVDWRTQNLTRIPEENQNFLVHMHMHDVLFGLVH